MKKSINRLLEYLRLFRFQTSAATATAPLIGGLVIGQRDIFSLLVLFLIGIIYHIYGFVLNEYIDVDVDRKSSDLNKKPLVSGSISLKNARYIIVLSIICVFTLTILFFPYPLPILFLLLSILCGGIYDVYGKKLLGSDFILGAGFFFICLTGASSFSTNFTIITYIVCFLYFFHIVFNNAVEGGLKDAYHDRLAGVKTTATRLGVYIKKGKPVITISFKLFAYLIVIIFICLILFLIYKQNPYQWLHKFIIQIGLIVTLSSILFITLIKFLQSSTFKRSRLKRLFSAHEIISYTILLIALSPMIELRIILILFFLPSVWYIIFNYILYKTLLQPLV